MVGRDSSLVMLMARGRELLEDREQRAGAVLALEAHDRRLVVPGGSRDAVAHDHEAGLVLGVVLDLAGEDLEARRWPRPGGCRSTPCPCLRDFATCWAASAVELAATAVASGRCFAIHMRVWPSGFGCETTVVMSASFVPGGDTEVQRHRQVDLPLHEQLGVEGEGVEGDGDRALDRVLDGHDAEVDVAALDRGDHVRDVAERHRLARGEVGLRAQRLFRERAVGPEEPDPGHRREA